MNILCMLGLHKVRVSQRYLPDFNAIPLEEYTIHAECERCGKVKLHDHRIWDDNIGSFIKIPYPLGK